LRWGKTSLQLVEPLLPSGVEVWQRACHIFVLCPWSGLSPVHSLLEQCILDVVIWSEVCLWFFYPRIEPPTPLTRASSLHDRTNGAASAESVIAEVSRSASADEMRQNAPLKRRCTSMRLHGLVLCKVVVFIYKHNSKKKIP
jgi:hypothetical protein